MKLRSATPHSNSSSERSPNQLQVAIRLGVAAATGLLAVAGWAASNGRAAPQPKPDQLARSFYATYILGDGCLRNTLYDPSGNDPDTAQIHIEGSQLTIYPMLGGETNETLPSYTYQPDTREVSWTHGPVLGAIHFRFENRDQLMPADPGSAFVVSAICEFAEERRTT